MLLALAPIASIIEAMAPNITVPTKLSSIQCLCSFLKSVYYYSTTLIKSMTAPNVTTQYECLQLASFFRHRISLL